MTVLFVVTTFVKKCIEPIIEKARSVNRSARCPTCRRKILGFSRSKIADELLTEVGTLKEEKRELELEKETLQKTIGQLKQEKGENEWKRKYEELKKSSETAHKEIEKKLQSEKHKIASLNDQLNSQKSQNLKKTMEIQEFGQQLVQNDEKWKRRLNWKMKKNKRGKTRARNCKRNWIKKQK